VNSEDDIPFLSGAGGYWQVIDEVTDSWVIQQQDPVSCGPACAEMLLRDFGINNVSQGFIAQLTGVPVNVQALAQALNQLEPKKGLHWIGGGFAIEGAEDAEVLEVLISQGSWIAELRETGARLGHLVVVDGYNREGRIRIRDPWERTKYKIEPEEFLKYWTFQGIYVKKL
jgi:ABC-type bacteriocin/lantibiotic exporter with double-glycine peptidase domain